MPLKRRKTKEIGKSEHLPKKNSPVAHVGGGSPPPHPREVGFVGEASIVGQLISCQVLHDGLSRPAGRVG